MTVKVYLDFSPTDGTRRVQGFATGCGEPGEVVPEMIRGRHYSYVQAEAVVSAAIDDCEQFWEARIIRA